MIALDTNILVYAHRVHAAEHERARNALERVANDPRPWALPWPVAHEFVSVVTAARDAPAPLGEALGAVASLLATPGCRPIAEARGYWNRLQELALAGNTLRSRVYDARIAAICLQHGVSELWTSDRDFGRFPELRVVNPLFG